MRLEPGTYKLTDAGSLGKISLLIGLAGLAASFFGLTIDRAQFFHSYLTAFSFWVQVGLGGLFFTMLHHLTGAKWGIVLRRMTESIGLTLPMLAVLFIPLAFGMHDLYHWTHAEAVAEDHLLQGKAGYLNVPFFLIRTGVYFTIWTVIAVMLHRVSLRQDKNPTDLLIKKMRKISAPGMLLFALTITYSSFDWLMSLDPHWYSTIFGVYIFSGTFLAILSFMVLIGRYLNSKGLLVNDITVEHYHDVGKFMFAFIIFWAYMAFSQYFLIWYANIPEETVWFLNRWKGTWKTVSLVIIFGHFAIPFVIMIFRASKRSRIILPIMAVMLLVMRFVDIHWLVLPNLHHDDAAFSWMDFTTMVGIGGIFVWFFWKRFTAHPLVPIGEPSLEYSRKFIS